jgi:hypothetical protein
MEDEATEAFVAAANDELSRCFPFHPIHMLNDISPGSRAIVRHSGLL